MTSDLELSSKNGNSITISGMSDSVQATLKVNKKGRKRHDPETFWSYSIVWALFLVFLICHATAIWGAFNIDPLQLYLTSFFVYSLSSKEFDTDGDGNIDSQELITKRELIRSSGKGSLDYPLVSWPLLESLAVLRTVLSKHQRTRSLKVVPFSRSLMSLSLRTRMWYLFLLALWHSFQTKWHPKWKKFPSNPRMVRLLTTLLS